MTGKKIEFLKKPSKHNAEDFINSWVSGKSTPAPIVKNLKRTTIYLPENLRQALKLFGIVRFSVDKTSECSKNIYSLVNSILCQESRVLSSVLLPQLFFLLLVGLSIYCLTFLMRLQIC